MTKYLVFAWTAKNFTDVPDEVLGTTHELQEEWEANPQEGESPDATYFGLRKVFRDVTLPKNIFRGKTFPMHLFFSYATHSPEKMKPFLAYYEIPGTGELDG